MAPDCVSGTPRVVMSGPSSETPRMQQMVYERIREAGGSKRGLEDLCHAAAQAADVMAFVTTRDGSVLAVGLPDEERLAERLGGPEWPHSFQCGHAVRSAVKSVRGSALADPIIVRVHPKSSGRALSLSPVVLERDIEGVVCLLHEGEQTELISWALLCLSGEAGHHFREIRLMAELEKRFLSSLVDDLISPSGSNNPMLIERLTAQGYEAGVPFSVILMETAPSDDAEAVRTKASQVVRELDNGGTRKTLVRCQGPRLTIAHQSRLGVRSLLDDSQAFYQHVERRASGAPVWVASGRPHTLAQGVHRSHEEAERALEIVRQRSPTGGILAFADLGMLNVLFESLGSSASLEYVEALLEPLLVYDTKKKHNVLIHTIASYLSHDCNLSETASALHLHKNSLRYRLSLIERLTGQRIGSLETQAAFLMALNLKSLMPFAQATSGSSTGGTREADRRPPVTRSTFTSSPARPIKIGSVLPLTGFAAADGLEQLQAATLAVEQWNARGGVAGRDIEYVVVDVGDMEPETMMFAFHKLIVEENVDAIINGYLLFSGPEYEMVADLETIYLHVNTLESNPQIYRSNPERYWMCFMCDPSQKWYGIGFPYFLDELERQGLWKPKKKRIAIVAASDPYASGIADSLSGSMNKHGWDVAMYDIVQSPVHSWDTILEKLHSKKPEVVFISDLALDDIASFTLKFKNDPIQALLYGQYVPSLQDFMDITGDACNGIVWSTVVGVVPGDLADRFFEDYEGRWGVLPGRCIGGILYDEVNMYLTAVALAHGATSKRDIAATLGKMWHRGVCGVYRFTRDRHVPSYPYEVADPASGQAHLFVQIQDGQHRIVYPSPYTEGKFRAPSWF